eukprot:10211638-Alexandrium_andersonii.AAC.1
MFVVCSWWSGAIRAPSEQAQEQSLHEQRPTPITTAWITSAAGRSWFRPTGAAIAGRPPRGAQLR